MVDRARILVRRPQASDLGRIADFVSRAVGGRGAVDVQRVLGRLGDVGFFLAEQDGNLVGLIGWHVENLVGRVTDLLVWPSRRRGAVGSALFREMESAALRLQAEAVVLLLPRPSRPELVEFARNLGYEPRRVAHMPRPWRETAYEAGWEDDEEILVKQLRSQRVFRPL